MPRKILSAARRRAAARNRLRRAYLGNKYGWTFRGALSETGRRIGAGFGHVGRGAAYAASPIMWAGRKIYENPMGTAAMLGAGALGVAASTMMPGAYLASPLLSYGVPVLKHLASKYIPIKSNRFTRGLNQGVGMAMTGLSLATAGGIPAYLYHGAMGALNARQMYMATKRDSNR
jgi:hypothetical protein